MNLSDKIKEARKRAETLVKYNSEQYKEFVWKYSFQEELKKIVNDDLMNNNPEGLFKDYKEYFETKKLPSKSIDTIMTVFIERMKERLSDLIVI